MAAVRTKEFYDSLADDYHLMFRDWWTSARHQGEVLDRLLRAHGLAPGTAVLDCTCGIGTQALPLAGLGYQVTGSDLSPSAVARARAEADRRGLPVELSVSDVRALDLGRFDVVLSGDNSLPHLRTDADLSLALTAIHRNVRPGGLFLASVRDYDALARDRVTGVTPTTFEDDGVRRIVGQTWTWSDHMRTVTFDLFLLEQHDTGWDTRVRTTVYRAWRRQELTEATQSAGFTNITWHEPEATGFHQPIMTCQPA